MSELITRQPKSAPAQGGKLPAWAAKIVGTRKRLKMNQKAFALALGVSQGNVSRWEAGAYKPAPEVFMKLARLAEGDIDSILFMTEGGVPTTWFMGAKQLKGMVPKAVAEDAVRQALGQRVAELVANDSLAGVTGAVRPVPLLRDAAAAGSPRSVDDKDIDEIIQFPRKLLPSGGTIFAVPVIGDSMSPILEEGDIVLVDVSKRDPAELNESMIAARVGDGVTIKYLRKSGRFWQLVPQNTSVRHEIKIVTEDDDWSVVGEVVKCISDPPRPRK